MKEILQSCLLLLGGMMLVLLLQRFSQVDTPTVPQELPTVSTEPSGNTVHNGWEVTVLATGKSDCILVQDQDFVMVIDTAEQDDFPILQYYLSSYGIETIDVLLITHYDKDHVGGAGDLVDQYDVRSVIVPDFPRESNHVTRFQEALERKNIQAQLLTQNMKLQLPSGSALFQPTFLDFPEGEDNNSSILLSLYLEDSSFLFMGDAEAERIAEFLQYNTEQYDFIKMPHHGRYNKMTEALVQEVQPQYAVITCSVEDLPDKETLAVLEKHGVSLWNTVDGMVKLSEFMKISP